ncbi:hypothetical protein BAC2_01025 [uncultured bacterium]|nr:hypothetical protein BAC2_01025 [uncultured bacterium]
MRAMKAITFLSAALVGALLCAGVADKLMHWELFVIALARNPLIPEALAGAVAGGTIALEAAVAAVLFVPSTRRTGLLLGALLFGSFAVIIALLLWLAPAAHCGCSFIAGFDRPTVPHLLLNVLIALLCGYLFATGHRPSPTITGMRVPGAAATTSSTTSLQRSAP